MRATIARGRQVRAVATIRTRALLETLDRHLATRAVAGAVARLLARAALRRLARTPGVRGAYARGSHGRGDFVPLASDLDLAVVLCEPGRTPVFEATLAVVGALDRLRRWNPLVRDAWHMLVGDTEWPLFERHASLFQLDEWRDLEGRPPRFRGAPVDGRLVLAARWNRLHLWMDGALRHALAPSPFDAAAAVAFAASEKKALSLAAAIEGTPPPRYRRPPPRGKDEVLARAAVLLATFERAARLVAAGASLGAAEPPRTVAAAREDERMVVAALRRTECAARLHAAVLHSGIVAVVTAEEAPSKDDLASLLRELPPVARETGRRFVVYSPLTLALAPIYEPARTVAVADPPAFAREEPQAEPLLLREQITYEALFAGADLRSTAARAADDPAAAYLRRRIARLLVYLEQGRLVRDGASALLALRSLRPELADALAQPGDRRRGFAAEAAAFVALVEALERTTRTPADPATR
jgi:hypothetical protein